MGPLGGLPSLELPEWFQTTSQTHQGKSGVNSIIEDEKQINHRCIPERHVIPYIMKAYQQTMENPEFLAFSIVLLEHTSPNLNLTDPRFSKIRKASQFFESWKRTVQESPFQVASKHFLTRETAEDLQSTLVGFLSLCQLYLTSGNSINPGYINSDIVENFRFTRMG